MFYTSTLGMQSGFDPAGVAIRHTPTWVACESEVPSSAPFKPPTVVWCGEWVH
jgi:hypothetical protein